MTQETHTAFVEFTLFCLDVELVLQRVLQDLKDVLHMLRNGLGKDQDVIQVDKDKFVQHIL